MAKKGPAIKLVHLMAVTKLHVQKHLKNSLMSRIELCYEIYKLTIFREELAKSGAADFTVLRAIAKFTNFTIFRQSLLRF